MKKSLTALLLFTFQIFVGSAQNVGIGTITPSAKLEIVSTNSGILIPRLSTTKRTSIINPPKGLLVYDSTAKHFYYHDGAAWQSMSASASSFWQQNGIAGNEIKNTNAGGFWSAAALGLGGYADNLTNPPTAPVSGPGTRLMWIPSRSAFRVGTDEFDNWDASKIGLFSFATGVNTTASGKFSTAMGYNTLASDNFSMAMGYSTTAAGNNSTAMGDNTTAAGIHSTAIGFLTLASGDVSTAIGYNTAASGNYSTAMGNFGRTNGHIGSFIIHDYIDENVDGITRNSLDNQMIMKFDCGFGFYAGDASAPSMGFEKTQGLSVYGSNIRAVSGIVTANGVTLTSDQRFKNTIATINYGLNSIMKLRPVSYLWNADRLHNNNALKGTQLGFIAQEVEKVIPSAVLTDADSLQSKSIKYMEIIPVLTKAIQEQQAQIELLQKQNSIMAKRLEKLEKK